jgi:3D (Asp-Asp-Asp) domain-containing protein
MRTDFLWSIVLCLLIMLTGACTSKRFRPPRGVRPVIATLEITAYSADAKSCGWKRNWWGRPVYAYGPNKGKPKKVGQTASGIRARRGTIAADTSIFPFGTIMYIPGYGYGRVEDRGGAIKGYHIDVFFRRRKDAPKWGRVKKRVKIWMPKK